MSEHGHHKMLFELDEQIQNELLAMQDTLSWLPEGELDNERYMSFANRISYISTLFNKTDLILRDLSFDPSQPNLVPLLEVKDRLQVNHDRFHRMSHEFHHRFDKDELSQEEERQRVMNYSAEPSQEPEEPEEPEPEPSDDDSEAEALLEELLAEEEEAEEKAEKAKKKKDASKRAAERQERQRQQYEAQNRADTAAADAARRERERWDAERRREEERYASQPTPLYTPLYDQPSYEPTPQPITPQLEPAPYWKNEAELRERQYREAERLSHEDRIRQEQMRLREEQMRRSHERASQPRYEYDVTAKRHFDFSTLDGEKGSRHDGRTEFKVYNYTPGGTVELTYNRDLASISSNPVIASTIGSRLSTPMSSAYEDTMRFNMQMARLNYESKRGTPEAKDALREYIHQRNSFTAYRDSIRTGSTETFAPKVTPHNPSSIPKRDYFSDARPVQYQYTPYGIVGNSVERGRLTNTQTTYHIAPTPHHQQIQSAKSHQYTAEKPLRVTPAYEQALTERMNHSRQVMQDALRTSKSLGSPAHIPADTAHEIRTATRAYAAFQAAKQAGTVVVSSDAPSRTVDYNYWQSQRLQNRTQSTVTPHVTLHNGPPSGTIKTHRATPQQSAHGAGQNMGSQRVPYNVLRKPSDFPVPVIVPGAHRDGPAHFKVTSTRVSSSDIRTGPNGMSGSDWLKSVQLNAHNKGDRTPIGTTGINANSGKKAETKEVSSDVLRHKSKLRAEHVAMQYARNIGGYVSGYSQMALMMASRKMYQMVQSGDETNPLRTFESGRYYLSTAIGVTHAVTHANAVSSMRTVNRGAGLERGYGSIAQLSKREFSRELQLHKRTGRALSEEIKTLSKNGVNLTGEELSKLKDLMATKAALDHETRKLYSLRALRQEFSAAAAMDRAIEAEAKGRPIRVKHVDAAMKKLRDETEAKMAKKFGNLNRMTNKSLSKEIKAATEEARALKKQISALKHKGVLSVSESKKLASLTNRKAALDADLRKYHGLKKARTGLESKLKAGNKRRLTVSKNRSGILGGLYALQGFVLKPFQQGDEIGAQGIAKAVNFSTNHYVHEFVKRSVRYSVATGKWAIHTSRLDVLARHAGKAAARTRPVRATKAAAKAVKKTAKQTAKTAATATKDAMVRMTPKPVKTAVKKSYHAASRISGRFGRAKAAVKGAADAAKNWLSNTALGRAYAWANKALHGAMSAMRTALAFVKGLIIKALLILAGFVMLVMLIVTVITSLGGAATSVMLVPGSTEDGKFDLSPYNNILVREWEEYEQELLDMGDAEGYYRTTVEIEPNVPNTREILSMMSVRMSQELDLRTNPQIEPYMSQLMRDLNPYVREEGTCYCDTRDCTVGVYYVSGSYTDEEGNTHAYSYPVYYNYCPGDHPTLTVTLYSLHFDAAFSADSMGAADSSYGATAGDLIGRFKITYYCAEKYPHICNAGPPYETATGTTPTAGRTIAVDPSVIPLNTRVMIDGHEYVAEDTGGAIDGNRIDIVVATHAEALRKGTRNNVPVYSVSYAGADIIDSGLWNGWTDGNKEWAKNIYSQDWTQLYSGIPNVTDLVGNNTDLSGVEFVDGDRPGYNAIANIGRDQLGNAGGSKFWGWYGFDYRVEWCAIFVSWCANQTGNLNSAIPKFALCEDGIRWYQNRGQWAARGDTTPVAGDIIFFDWGADGDPDHVGIVVGSDGTNVYTVEGNSGDQVRTKSYALNSSVIFGYGLPNY